MIIILFLFLIGISNPAGAQTLTITEQQLNSELERQLGREFPLTLGDWLAAGIRLEDLRVELGRQEADKARVTGRGIISVSQGERRFTWDLNGDFSARPRYDSEQGALYLDEFELLSYRLNDDGGLPQAGFMLPMLLQGVAGYLSQYPVYVLDARDPLQQQLRGQILGLEIDPGRLRLHGLD